jgi:hypothetical protein
MKSGCEFEELFEGYFSSDLSPAEELSLLNHLQSCVRCSKRIEIFYDIHSALKKHKRPVAPSDLVESYYKQVDLTFGRETLSQKIILFFSWFGKKRSPVIRIVQFASLVLIGIVVGWIVFAPVEPKIVFQSNDPYQMSQPISSVDIEYIYYYLQVSEMVLLEIQNYSDPVDFYLNRELAKKLLIKTFRVSEIALQINNLRLINFLNRMELLLHEASNLNMEEMEESLDTIKMVIEEADLLREVKTLETIMKRTKDQFGI